jgi:hypothetical protein
MPGCGVEHALQSVGGQAGQVSGRSPRVNSASRQPSPAPLAGDRQDLVRREEHVATRPLQLPGGHQAGVPHPGSDRAQLVELRPAGIQQSGGLGRVYRGATEV